MNQIDVMASALVYENLNSILTFKDSKTCKLAKDDVHIKKSRRYVDQANEVYDSKEPVS